MLVFLDESTSAIDVYTESIIYQTMLRLKIWFITISHRPSLKSYHSIELKLDNGASEKLENSFEDKLHSMEIDTDNTTPFLLQNNSTVNEIQVNKCQHCSWWKSFIKIWYLIHVPFDPKEHKTLRIQVTEIFFYEI
jgi:hypothetical protein